MQLRDSALMVPPVQNVLLVNFNTGLINSIEVDINSGCCSNFVPGVVIAIFKKPLRTGGSTIVIEDLK